MSFFEAKVKKPIVDLLTSGASPHSLALSMAFGVTCGIFPIPGVTSVPVVAAVFLFGLNPVAAMLMNYLCTPLNIASVPVFVAYGGQFFGAGAEDFSVSTLLQGLQDDTLATLGQFQYVLLHAIYMWLVFLPIGTLAIYLVLYPILKVSIGSAATKPKTT
ncbi:hypothetical protein SPRG_06594 [Saprolegnia parasitica CBS 223.65]|uniref:DUF2062 domain-containing protein n=1 Tax=Saprolegnia parasitica (strain CBS 223.65) TaxID=695850 RepID=A0A067BI38_SAPPC|nr:hypothetical protein SPRG_06594 [Saprolegnia parasitica CBS 223.65]XP_012212892.1 hypothetical protein SPRG_18074 [Saprolegnia parasitica CBS 223.65]KDO16400.1 hypothetical protein SPRG_18074 [Saprolegnia parasitica CBS 223.65]KDO28355.1 hypothetical protein SPRG_06594 [Saprolegnia parasitica CBS 223.65]|eukprot:XP_012200803.1 hypothetical protein SPRG_06594 [Saprolegnia parasitica CBS 223.65]